MRKLILSLMVGMLLAGSTLTASAVNENGGFMGFVAGCCFGMRTGAAYNDGKEIHWREWVMYIPVANIVFLVWNGIDGANGVTTSDYAKEYGASFF